MGAEDRVPFEPLNFLAAERAAEEAVEAILTAGGEQLYQAYIDRKSFPFASEAVTDVVRLELQMCFVRHDQGEPDDDADLWALEPEPMPNLSDTWSRACVPVRKKYVRKTQTSAEDAKGGRRGRSVKTGNSMAAGSSPAKAVAEAESGKLGGTRAMMIPLVEEREEDEEETMMREMKEREAKRKREEEARLARKAQEEAEEAMRLAQVKDQMKNKPYTYDSEGNIIWIQPVATDRLPNATPALNYNLKKAAQKEEVSGADRGGVKVPKKVPKKRVRKEPEFVDSFKKLPSVQPPMMEAMSMAPGVQLAERGRSKKGFVVDGKEKGKMTRKDYTQMVSNTGGGFNQEQSMNLDAPQSVRDADMVAASFDQASGSVTQGMGENDAFNLAIVTSSDWGNNPPPGEKPPMQPVPPPMTHHPKLKRDAIGYRLGARDRMPTSGTPGAGPTQYRPHPPLGASMGHGLLPSKPGNHGEFYFPQAPQGPAGMTNVSESEEEVAAQQQSLATPRGGKQGEIHAQNRQLIQRLFK